MRKDCKFKSTKRIFLCKECKTLKLCNKQLSKSRIFQSYGQLSLVEAYNVAYRQNIQFREIIYNLEDQLTFERQQNRYQLEKERLKYAKSLSSHQQYIKLLEWETLEMKKDLANLDFLNKRCKAKDELLQEAKIENKQQKNDIDALEYKITAYKQDINKLDTLVDILRGEKSDLESRLRSRSPLVVSELQQCKSCHQYRKDISDLRNEVNGLRDRLSETAGNKLRDNNPNIADLSDMNRPTSLAEKFSSLYTDEYTNAFEVIENNKTEADCTGNMLQWLKNCYDCAAEQRSVLSENSLGFMQKYLVCGFFFATCLYQ